MRVAIPTQNPGGLEGVRSDHFGHCDVFTVVDLDEEKKVTGIETVANEAHGAGGCMIPVTILKNANVDAIVVGGMGARPMQGFSEVGITVYFADRSSVASVEDVISHFRQNALPIMHGDQACKGSSNCHH